MGDLQISQQYRKLENLASSWEEWNGVCIEAYADGNLDLYYRADQMRDKVESRIRKLESEMED